LEKKMSDPDISVIVTAHNEGVILGATLNSAVEAVAAARDAGLNCQLLLGFDDASPTTKAIAEHPSFNDFSVHELALCDPYLTRNEMAEKASGKLIAFLDGDDLVSENWLTRGVELQQKSVSERHVTVIHPEMNVIFDRQTGAFAKIEQLDPLFLPEVFYFENYYDLMAIAPRSLYLEHPFCQRDIELGYGFQDWQWNLETMAAGVLHLTAANTIVFKRRRPDSISEINRSQRAVVYFVKDALRIDRVRGLGRRDPG
jgi:glycosyltransferase involved in cell wall biosynthesis